MTINAKRVSRDGTVENVSLSDNPTDVELIKALGGDPSQDSDLASPNALGKV